MSQSGTNSLGRLNEVLFAELERLDTLDVTDEDALKSEVARSKAIQSVAREINQSASTILESVQLKAHLRGIRMDVPKLLEE